MPAVQASHSPGVKNSAGPAGFLESRTPTRPVQMRYFNTSHHRLIEHQIDRQRREVTRDERLSVSSHTDAALDVLGRIRGEVQAVLSSTQRGVGSRAPASDSFCA